MKKGTLVLLRHGESTWNVEDRFAGASDVPLTPLGEQQALKAGASMRGYPFDFAYSSTLQRAQDTLRLALESMGLPHLPSDTNALLNERHFGALEGQKRVDLEAAHGFEQVDRWRFGWNEPVPGTDGETFEQLTQRVLAFYESEVAPRLHNGASILLVAHGQSLRSLAMQLEGADILLARQFYMDNAQPVCYTFDHDTPVRLDWAGVLARR